MSNILQEVREQGITPHYFVVHRKFKCIARVHKSPDYYDTPVYFMYKVILPNLTFVLTQPLEHVETASTVYYDHSMPYVNGASVLTMELINGSTVYHTTLDMFNATMVADLYQDQMQLNDYPEDPLHIYPIEHYAETVILNHVKNFLTGMFTGHADGIIELKFLSNMPSEGIRNILSEVHPTTSDTSGLQGLLRLQLG